MKQTNTIEKKSPLRFGPGGIQYEDKGNQIFYWRMDNLTQLHHFHSHLEVIYKESGSCRAYADDRAVTLQAGDLFWAFPNQIHHYEDITDGKSLVLLLPEQALGSYHRELRHYVPLSPVLHEFDRSSLLPLLEKIPAAMEQGAYGNAIALGYANALVGELLHICTLEPVRTNDLDATRLVVNYCSQNYTKKVTLEELEQALHISKYHISHLFSSKMKISFTDYLNALRIEDACARLRAENPITETALQSGFSTIRSFNRAFIRHTGMTPRQFQKLQHRENRSEDQCT